MRNESAQHQEGRRALRTLGYVLLVGVVATIAFGLQYDKWVDALFSTASGLAMAGAALLGGGLVGFVFAIPRTLQQDGNAQAGDSPAAEQGTGYQANTNLEQISDWLTKIIIGVGLVELNEVPGLMHRLAEYAKPALGTSPASGGFAVFILSYFMISGFLFGYLWTRLYMVGALRTADTIYSERFDKVEEEIQKIRTREELDARALSLLQRQLEPNEDEPKIEQDELDKAVAEASGPVRSTIFREAEKLRRATWRDPSEKHRMERTIPIFKALIHADPNFHRDHAQLGYALKDQRAPNLEGARRELNEAIRLRDEAKIGGYLMYEMNRAECDIRIEKEAGRKGPSPDDVRERILSDLGIAAKSPEVKKIIDTDAVFQDWIKANKASIPQ